MKTESTLLVALILLASRVPCLAEMSSANPARDTSVPGELLVKWRDGPMSAAAADGNRSIGASVKRSFEAIGWQYVKLPEGLSLADAMARYRALGTVLAVEPNWVMTPVAPVAPRSSLDGATIGHLESSASPSLPSTRAPDRRAAVALASTGGGVIPNDPNFKDQWNLKLIGMPTAWEVTTGSTNVVVALIDTGVDYNHEDLKDNMWRNPGETGLDANGGDKATNGIDDDGDGYVDDVYGVDVANGTGDPMDTGSFWPPGTTPFNHGTFCAGLIGASGNNGKGMVGVNWSVRIMAIHRSGGNYGDPQVFTFPRFISPGRPACSSTEQVPHSPTPSATTQT